MKHGIQLHACPINILNNEFPTPADTAIGFVSIVALNSQSEGLSLKDQQRRATEESATMYKEPFPDNNISINSAITLQEVSDAIVNLAKNKSSVGTDQLSYSMLSHLPDTYVKLLYCLYQQCYEEGIATAVWNIP